MSNNISHRKFIGNTTCSGAALSFCANSFRRKSSLLQNYNAVSMVDDDESTPNKCDNSKKWLGAYDRRLRKRYVSEAEGSGQRAINFFACNAFSKCNTEFPLDVYNLANRYIITTLNQKSDADTVTLEQISDFAKWQWKSGKPLFGLSH